MADTVTVDCIDIELDNGENLLDLGVGNYLEVAEPIAGMSTGSWVLVAYEGDGDAWSTRAQLRRLTAEEIHAFRTR
jgi:hypothetical protein